MKDCDYVNPLHVIIDKADRCIEEKNMINI